MPTYWIIDTIHQERLIFLKSEAKQTFLLSELSIINGKRKAME
jgi:hypothetical protein